jgi:hypothetical protein
VTLRLTGVAVLLFMASIVLGIIGLCGISKYGTDGILWRSVRGIVVSVIRLGLLGEEFVRGFQSARQNRQALASVEATAKEVNNDLKKELASQGTLGPGSTDQTMNKLKAAMDKAVKESTGDTALVAKASSTYLNRLMALVKSYQIAADGIAKPQVLDMKGVTERGGTAQTKKQGPGLPGCKRTIVGVHSARGTDFPR